MMSQDHMKPEEPTEEDCCNSGCANCVLDVYRLELEKWSRKQFTEREKHKRFDLLSKTQFRPFTLIGIVKVNEFIWFLKFQSLVDEKESELDGILPYDVGQHLIVRCYLNETKETVSTDSDNCSGTKQVTRAYSIITDARHQKDCCFEVVMKLYPNGIMSRYINSLSVSDVTYWRGPYGDFKYSPNDFKNILMLCMGTGVAPLYPVIRRIVLDEDDFTLIKLVVGVRSLDQIILRDELCNLASYWNFKFVYYITGEYSPEMKRHHETFRKGRIGLESIGFETERGKLENSLVLISGSESFSNDMVGYVSFYNVPDKNIFVF